MLKTQKNIECIKGVTKCFVFLEMNDHSILNANSNEPLQCFLCFDKLWWMSLKFQSWMPSWFRMNFVRHQHFNLGLKRIIHSWMHKVKIWYCLPMWRASRHTSFIFLTLTLVDCIPFFKHFYLLLMRFILLTTRCQIGMNMNMLITSACKS